MLEHIVKVEEASTAEYAESYRLGAARALWHLKVQSLTEDTERLAFLKENIGLGAYQSEVYGYLGKMEGAGARSLLEAELTAALQREAYPQAGELWTILAERVLREQLAPLSEHEQVKLLNDFVLERKGKPQKF